MGGFDISFIIPCYNAGSYLIEAVDSVMAQQGDFEIVEIIVVDDRSDDPATLESLATVARLEKVKVVANTGPKGAAGARNAGLDIARGEWIAFFDADDVMTENGLQIRCRAGRNFPDCGWISADFVVWNEDGSREPTSFYSSRPRPKHYFAKAFAEHTPIRLDHPVRPFLDCCLSKIGANLIRRDLIRAAGPFDPELRMAEDHQLYVRLARLSDLVFVPEVVLLYRRHESNTTKADVPPGLWTIRAFSRLLGERGMREYRKEIFEVISMHYSDNSYYYRNKGNFFNAVLASMAAIYHMPSSRNAWRALAGSVLGRR